VMVGSPASLIGLRQQPAGQNASLPEVAHRTASPAESADREAAPPTRVQEAPPAAKSSVPAAPAQKPAADLQAAPRNEPPAEMSAPVVAAAPPPPPPPPPPAPVANAERDEYVVVTGSRIAEPNLPRREASRQQKANAFAGQAQSYAAFLGDLRAAVRADDKAAIIAMVALPLRVTVGGRTRSYRDAASVSQDFDRIFSERVRRAILEEAPDRLSISGDGAEIGDGEVTFGRSSPVGSVRIVAVNPQG
jgi:hypothetical protein